MEITEITELNPIEELKAIQLEVIGSPKGTVLKTGDIIHDKFRRFTFINDVLKACGIWRSVDDMRAKLLKEEMGDCTDYSNKAHGRAYKKAFNKAVRNHTRVSQREFIKLLNGRMYEAFIKPLPTELYNHFCFNRSGPSPTKINELISNLDLVMQTYADKLIHLIPIVLVTRKTPQQLKVVLGKSVWKHVCRNSISRNKAIARYSIALRRDRCSPEAAIQRAVHLPTTLLDYVHASPEVMEFLKNSAKGQWGKTATINLLANKARDTLQMAQQNGIQIDITKWSIRRLEEEHDNLTKMMVAKRYSPDKFRWADQLPIGEFSFEGYTVTPLLSAAEIGAEGAAMRHCVGSYALQSSYGTYLVFSVKKYGQRHSTIGYHMSITESGAFRIEFQQHYKFCNAMLEVGDPARHIDLFIKNYFKDCYAKSNSDILTLATKSDNDLRDALAG